MKELLVATCNRGKLREIRELLKDLDLKITSLVDYPGLPEIVEDGKTFRANAVKKAMTISRHTNKLVMGEDSGLEVEALDGAPGVYSARFAGPFSGGKADDQKNNAKLLRMLRGVPLQKRQARYRCFAALADGKKLIGVVNGSCSGMISRRAYGKNGFGYDPFFFIPQYNKTFGQLDPQIKAQISHRAKALKKMKRLLLKDFSNHVLHVFQ